MPKNIIEVKHCLTHPGFRMFFCFSVSYLLCLLSPETLSYVFQFWERHDVEHGGGQGKRRVDQGII